LAKRDDVLEFWQSRKAERARQLRERREARAPEAVMDPEQTLADLSAADAATRARAARELCPCHSDWGVFEQNLDVLRQMTKDASPVVRANALHVFEDAFELENEGLPTTPQAVTNEMVARRRQTRWRNDEGAEGAEDGDPKRRNPDYRRGAK